MKTIILNRAKCLRCGEVIISHYRHNFVTCRCRSICVDGGLEYLRRLGDPEYILDMSIYSTDSFDMIRHTLYRGTFDEEGNRKWVLLKDLTDDHLLNIIQYCIDKGQTGSIHYNYYLKEKEFRNI